MKIASSCRKSSREHASLNALSQAMKSSWLKEQNNETIITKI